MKKLVVLLVLCLFASNSFAAIDPDNNSLGLYFDTAANIVETTTAMGMMYAVLVNPTFPLLAGLEFGIDVGGTCTLSFMPVAGSLPVGPADDLAIGYGEGLTTTPVTVCGSWMYMAMGTVYLTLTNNSKPSIPDCTLPIALTGAGDFLVLGTSAGEGDVCAMVNDTGVVDAQSETWGGVKSLYR